MKKLFFTLDNGTADAVPVQLPQFEYRETK